MCCVLADPKELPDMALVPGDCPPELREAMLRGFAFDPTRRPTFARLEPMLAPSTAIFVPGITLDAILDPILTAIGEHGEAMCNGFADAAERY